MDLCLLGGEKEGTFCVDGDVFADDFELFGFAFVTAFVAKERMVFHILGEAT